jgi:very-short-patch-repair endonuclease
MRHEPVTAKRMFWRYIRDRRLGGFKFRRQHPTGPYIVDHVCLEKKVVVELDGSIHENQVEYDVARDRKLESQGYRVLRFDNYDVSENIGYVFSTILMSLRD